MKKALEVMRERLVTLLKKDERVLGGWYFGSAARGLADVHADLDIVLVIAGQAFADFDSALSDKVQACCQQVLINWPESFNHDAIKNYAMDVLADGELCTVDVFLLNSHRLNDWWCRLHYTGTKQEDVFFDRDGSIAALIHTAPPGEIPYRDVSRLVDTYWHHVIMIQKYFLRRDYFKLIKNLQILFETHVELLLSAYDKIPWGGWDSKAKYIPAEKQGTLKQYFASCEMSVIYENLICCVQAFSRDAKEIFLHRQLGYPHAAETQAIDFLKKADELAGQERKRQ